jgi:hypothetical protein
MLLSLILFYNPLNLLSKKYIKLTPYYGSQPEIKPVREENFAWIAFSLILQAFDIL